METKKVLNDLGGTKNNSLLHISKIDNENSEYPQILEHSPYFNNDDLISVLKNKNKILKCMSLNIQCLKAKFNQLQIYVDMLNRSNISFDIICIQETWLSDGSDTSMLELDGYSILTQSPSSSTHGGLAMYIKQDIKYKELTNETSPSNIWEGQFVQIHFNEAKLTIGNVYRPPRDVVENYKTFTTEFQNCIEKLNGEALIAGDFNIDLLKIGEKAVIGEYFDTIISSGYIPKITLPTRLSKNRGTLIDNFLSKLSKNFSKTTSGIMTYKISDHQPYFTCLDYLKLKYTPPKFIKITTHSDEAIDKFKLYLSQQNIMSKLDSLSDPNLNYEILLRTVENGLNLHLPERLVRFSRQKHKISKWITHGVINSINFRDKLYCKLKKTSSDR